MLSVTSADWSTMSGVPRLEDTRLVEGSYHQEIIDSQIIRERHYTLTAEGSVAWDGSRDFYLAAIRGFEGREGLAGA